MPTDSISLPGASGSFVPALLVLEDGRHFWGESFGATGETFGEAVFSTAMTGYEEILTDPSCFGQVVVSTTPHIGNTGWNGDDAESDRIWAAGHVVRDLSRVASNWRAEKSLPQALAEAGVVGISGVDTRALTRHIREEGAMRVGISTTETDPATLLERVLQHPPMAGRDLTAEVTISEPRFHPATVDKRFTVAAIDLGIKYRTPYRLTERGIDVHLLPADTTFEQIQALDVDGVFFSNGPGDPSTGGRTTALMRQVLAAELPVFGICFGHQMFGRALGFDTYKLKYGHRGGNQPVMDLTTRKVEITAHNHGFAIDAPLEGHTQTPYGQVRVTHVCLNDQVVEGLELSRDGKVAGFSVQYHPEAAAGPHDASYLFDRFVSLMAGQLDAEGAR